MHARLASLFAALPAALLLSLTIVTGAVGCKGATIIGTSCKSDGDCNVDGQVCAPGFSGGPSICTRKCTGNTGASGCPIGYDCFPTDESKGMTCNKVRYEFDAAGLPTLFGKDCSLDNSVCGTVGSTNPGVTCRKISDGQDPPMPVASDPNAFCTGSCEGDGDCPLDLRCAEDYDGVKKCLRRTLCSECRVDENCPEGVCVPNTNDVPGRYCSKLCNNTNDCGGNQNTAYACRYTTNNLGADVLACVQRFGSCTGAGQVCDPCRKTSDCTAPDTGCIYISATGEGYCSKECNQDSDCAGGTVEAECDNDDVYNPNTNPYGMSLGYCQGKDASPGQLSCYALPI